MGLGLKGFRHILLIDNSVILFNAVPIYANRAIAFSHLLLELCRLDAMYNVRPEFLHIRNRA